jgi:hypothetical protein
MAWNDNANVCGSESQLAVGDSQVAEGTTPTAFALLVTIDKATQRMTVSLDGVERYVWPVSTGLAGYSTPSGTYTARSMNEMWYSKQWDNAPMPHAVFFTREGHAIHGTNEVKRLGNPASHGCVRISPQNAATLYDLVSEAGLENTQIVLAGLTPGGEGRWASSAGSRASYRLDSDDPPRRRGGLFGDCSAVDRASKVRQAATGALPKSHAGFGKRRARRGAETNLPRRHLSSEGCVSVR